MQTAGCKQFDRRVVLPAPRRRPALRSVHARGSYTQPCTPATPNNNRPRRQGCFRIDLATVAGVSTPPLPLLNRRRTMCPAFCCIYIYGLSIPITACIHTPCLTCEARQPLGSPVPTCLTKRPSDHDAPPRPECPHHTRPSRLNTAGTITRLVTAPGLCRPGVAAARHAHPNGTPPLHTPLRCAQDAPQTPVARVLLHGC